MGGTGKAHLPAKGLMNAPRKPFPRPLAAPTAPSSRAPMIGCVKSPVTPSYVWRVNSYIDGMNHQ